MLNILSMVMLALAVSLDSFSVGMTYGLQKMKFPLRSIIVISILSGCMLLISMYVGTFLAFVLPVQVERWIAATILILLGVWAIYNVVRKQEETVSVELETYEEKNTATPRIWRLHLKRFGIVIQVLKQPSLADLDRSGTISVKEALLIGVALSMDAFGAGLSASFLGYSPMILALLVSTMNIIFIRVGLKIGRQFSQTKMMKKATIIPGTILICLGITKIFFK
jgi:putative sporulation protein YtaF